MVNVELPGEAGGGVTVLDAELAAGAIAVGVHRGLGHAELAGDLLGGQVLVDEPQTLALARCEQPHRIFGDDISCDHSASSKRRLGARVYFNAKAAAGSATL